MKYKFYEINTGTDDFTDLGKENPFYRTEVVEQFGRAYGQVYMFKNEDSAVLCQAIVKKAHRRKGIGKALHQRRINIAKSWGAKRICIWVSPTSPKWVFDWYTKLGYTKMEEKTEEGSIWYELILEMSNERLDKR